MDSGAFQPRTRVYGSSGPPVIALHGGPAAVGEVEPVARFLSKAFVVYEPFQRGSGDTPLTVAAHVEDLRLVVSAVRDDRRPCLAGHSWGAMLALAYASKYPETTAAIMLVGCGTFDTASRRRIQETVDARRGLTETPYEYDPIPEGEQLLLGEPFDERAHLETWNDMLRLQDEGVYPRAFSRITCPVAMLHGDHDPHPGRMIFAGLKEFVPQLEYIELPSCGHYPWRERQARKMFFMLLSNWLLEHGDKSHHAV